MLLQFGFRFGVLWSSYPETPVAEEIEGLEKQKTEVTIILTCHGYSITLLVTFLHGYRLVDFHRSISMNLVIHC
jgi:hypothetical protein